MKQCIFNEKKTCTNCGECNVCEHNRDKICDNCGKCLEIEGYDVKAIKIDEVFENEKEDKLEVDLENFSDFDTEEFEDDLSESEENEESQEELPYIDALDDENNWEFISDIDGMDELMEETDKNDILFEQSPGLFVINKKN